MVRKTYDLHGNDPCAVTIRFTHRVERIRSREMLTAAWGYFDHVVEMEQIMFKNRFGIKIMNDYPTTWFTVINGTGLQQWNAVPILLSNDQALTMVVALGELGYERW